MLQAEQPDSLSAMQAYSGLASWQVPQALLHAEQQTVRSAVQIHPDLFSWLQATVHAGLADWLLWLQVHTQAGLLLSRRTAASGRCA